MKAFLPALAALHALTASALFAQPIGIDPVAVRDAALHDDTAWEIVEGLTTEVGPRLAGTSQDDRARAWATAKLKALGFQNVRTEPFEIDGWERGAERADILSPSPQPLIITALGGSGATPGQGLVGEIVRFDGLAALQAAPENLIKGKIVFITHRMSSTQDASSYRAFGPIRQTGPSIAAVKGAVAVVIRSLGTSSHRIAHTGATFWNDGLKPIPAAALSIPDAEQLERLLDKGGPVRMKLLLTPRFTGRRTTGNVIGEIPGRDPKAGIVLIGGHLDSWDLGTGALDDGAGLAITTAAARLVAKAGQPLRTIRVVWFGSEETGAKGGDDYFRRHAAEKHAMAAEADFGADRVWRLDTGLRDANLPVIAKLANVLEPLGIARGTNLAKGGSDIRPLAKAGVPIVGLQQDGTRYFDFHHTADDTLDKLDSSQLRQNVAAWATLLSIAAEATNWPENGIIESNDVTK